MAESQLDFSMQSPRRRAIAIGALTYKSIASIIANKLDHVPTTTEEPQSVIAHPNLRGSNYFH